MYVIKRNGRQQPVDLEKITKRLMQLSEGLFDDTERADSISVIARSVIDGVRQGIATSELDDLASEIAAQLISKHYHYGTLAARLFVSNLHHNSHSEFSAVVNVLANDTCRPLIHPAFHLFVMSHRAELDAIPVYSRDYDYTYFGLKTLERSYLLKIDGKVVERPQHLLLRVAVALWYPDMNRIRETYTLLSERYFTHATPTLFHAGLKLQQLSSCYLLVMKEDSINGIYDTLKQCAQISKTGGGIGLSIQNTRARDAYIYGTGGRSNGIVPMLRLFNVTAKYVDQGGNKRPGAIAVYLEPWHRDILDFLELRKNTGIDDLRTRDLFLGLWVNDLFMERVEANKQWTLFCPADVPALCDTHGDTFKRVYVLHEKDPAFASKRQTIDARVVWNAILQSQMETGTPYMLFKDACNALSNQQHLGTIRCSNLCTEIIEYASVDEVAVCNLASLALPKFVNTQNGLFDFYLLFDAVVVATRNLDRIIDVNYYPLPEAQKSNLRHRPLGLGVQGLADVFAMLKLPFESVEAQRLNVEIFETIYFAAMSTSCELAEHHGVYLSYDGSMVSQGKLHPDLWDERNPSTRTKFSGRWDFKALRKRIARNGLRNSLLVAPMPTASTAQILGNNESFEPFTSNLYTRRVLAGEFQTVNTYLVRDLIERNMWNDSLRREIIAARGSVQSIASIPKDLKAVYKTVWEIPQRVLIDMAVDRAPFVDQSQSLNIHMTDASFAKLTSMHFYTWKKGLKTGMYYLRTRAAADAIQFTMDVQNQTTAAAESCSRLNKENCLSCSG